MSQEPKTIPDNKHEQFENHKQWEITRVRELAGNEIPPQLWKKFTGTSAKKSGLSLDEGYYYGLYQIAKGRLDKALYYLNSYRSHLKSQKKSTPMQLFYYIGMCQLMDSHLEKNAPLLFLESLESDYLLAGFPLALCYLYGWNVKINIDKAASIYEQLAYAGNEEAVLRYLQITVLNESELDSDEIMERLDSFQSEYIDKTEGNKHWKGIYYAAVYYKSRFNEEFARNSLWICIEKILKTMITGFRYYYIDLYLCLVNLNPCLSLPVAITIFNILDKEVSVADSSRHSSFLTKVSPAQLMQFMCAYQAYIKTARINNYYPVLNKIFTAVRKKSVEDFLQLHQKISLAQDSADPKTIQNLKEAAKLIFLTDGTEKLDGDLAADLLYDLRQVGLLTRKAYDKMFNRDGFTLTIPGRQHQFSEAHLISRTALFIEDIKIPSSRRKTKLEDIVTDNEFLTADFLSFQPQVPLLSNLVNTANKPDKNREWLRIAKRIKEELPEDFRRRFKITCRLNLPASLQDIYYLGLYYLEIREVNKCYDTLILYKALAERKSPQISAEIDYFLGICCLYKNLNLVEASKYLQRAADNGFLLSYFALAVCYKHGLGLPQDIDQAANCYLQLSDKGSQEGILRFLKIKLSKDTPIGIESLLSAIKDIAPGVDEWKIYYYAAVYYLSKKDKAKYNALVEELFKIAALQKSPVTEALIYERISWLDGLAALRVAQELLKIQQKKILSLGLRADRDTLTTFPSDYANNPDFIKIAIYYNRALHMGIVSANNDELNKILYDVRENAMRTWLSMTKALDLRCAAEAARIRVQIKEYARIIYLLGVIEAIGPKELASTLNDIGEYNCLALMQHETLLVRNYFGDSPIQTKLEKKTLSARNLRLADKPELESFRGSWPTAPAERPLRAGFFETDAARSREVTPTSTELHEEDERQFGDFDVS